MNVAASFRGVIFLAMPLALAACNGTTAADGGPSQANPLDAEEGGILQQLNVLRVQANVSLVTVCVSLDVSAAAHSDEMRDQNYLNDVSPTGSNVRTRACAAGYTPACTGTIPMAELVAEGFGTGVETVGQWAADPKSGPILIQAGFNVAGVGRSIGADNERWTLDLSSVADPTSCN